MSNTTYILDDNLIASNGSRFLNYILDIIFIMLSAFILTFIFAILSNLLEWDGLNEWLINMSDLESQLVFVIISILYYVFTEGLFGRSIGKFITGTVVVDENGEKPGFGAIFKRSLSRLIPFDAFSFLGSRGWHDSFSDTYVVGNKALKESIKTFKEFELIGVKENE
ncbi:RDD family protein [Flavobacterium sp. Fl-318]|jgi:uncharacterized RDD family membrane protein YckC|uniref:RDD family protein n=1 Tax=Flavobacterium cupriresistens TaxID=2893885 RepID=A0ABU4RJV6_9FLAO|nr:MULTISPECIES: RDD family protein [unclassified Flavobacterium]MDX6190801.1 RDD family protein [Flavobacterium sp. Fl-318]UFH44026.1 RDD family protein [Flavobacterium sp. F-323]